VTACWPPFGTEAAREDDAERAVHCGLALLAEGPGFAERVQAEHGHAGSDVRVGIHTGPVLLGGGVDEGDSIRGQAVNIAARMEQTAPAGTLRISHDTWMLVRGLFNVQAQAPLAVKGVAQALSTYLVASAKPRAFRVPTRGIEGVAHTDGRPRRRARRAGRLARRMRRRAGACRWPRSSASPAWARAGCWPKRRPCWSCTPRASGSFWAAATRSSSCSPTACCASCWPGAWASPTATAASWPASAWWTGCGPGWDEAAQAKAERIGQLLGMDFADSEHVRGLPPRALRAAAFQALAEYLHGLSAAGDALGAAD
jgi:hypothetical protein